MEVKRLMTRDVRTISPDVTIEQAAKVMADLDAGVVPVGEKDRLVGMVTDRDIAVRGIAEGKGPDAKVREVMTAEVNYCFDDQEVDEVTQNMSELQIRRLPVVNRSERLVGILSIGDIAFAHGDTIVSETMRAISEPGGQHSQTG